MASIRQNAKTKRWLVDFKKGFRRKRFSFYTRREAEEFKRELLLNNLGIDTETQDRFLLSEAVDSYINSVTSVKATHTQRLEQIVFRDFKSYFQKAFLNEIGLAELQEYQGHLRSTILGQSVNRRFNSLCHFFKTCVDWKLIKENPTDNLRRLPSTCQKAKRALTTGELQKLFDSATPWLRDVLWFIFVYSLRRSQAAYLRWGAIDFNKRYVHLESSPGFDNKDYDSNTLPMTDDVEVFLKDLYEKARKSFKAKPNDYVFLDDRGEQIHPDRLTNCAKKLMKNVVGIENGAVHILRHTSLTMRHRQGVSLDDVRVIAGHSNVKTTMLYLHSEPEHLREAMSKTPLFKPNWNLKKSENGGNHGT
jgi:site-specific recombinase XerD